ncbi:unnamed protein product [Coccothraustes coccothraustes]
MVSLLCCGPKMAACGLVLSAWGVVMLVRGPEGPTLQTPHQSPQGTPKSPPGPPKSPQIPPRTPKLPPNPLRTPQNPPKFPPGAAGHFFNVHSAVLIEDVPFLRRTSRAAPSAFTACTSRSATTASSPRGLYALLGGFSLCQTRLNKRKEYMVR